jgi:hypothetical protein
MPQSTGGACAQRTLSAAARAVASAVIVRVTQSTDTPAHKRAARNIVARATAAGQVHAVAPTRPKRGRSLAGELAAAINSTDGGGEAQSDAEEKRGSRARLDDSGRSEPRMRTEA